VLRALTEVCVVSRSECQWLAVWKVASDSRRRPEFAGDSGDCLGDGQKLLVVPAPSDYLDAERDTMGVDPHWDDHHGTTADLGEQQGHESPNGAVQMWLTGEYREVVENQRLVYTESISDENGNVASASDTGMPEGHPTTTEVRVELEDLGGHTKMIMTHAGIPGDAPGGAGWAMALNKLTAHVDALGQQWRQRRRRLPHGAVNRAFCTGRQRVLLEESGQACAFDGQPFGARVWPCPIRRATNRKRQTDRLLGRIGRCLRRISFSTRSSSTRRSRRNSSNSDGPAWTYGAAAIRITVAQGKVVAMQQYASRDDALAAGTSG
jgi:uncharacterized protein YndB with AHSA1/START domain